jgi:opacity protein-like surface antigen
MPVLSRPRPRVALPGEVVTFVARQDRPTVAGGSAGSSRVDDGMRDASFASGCARALLTFAISGAAVTRSGIALAAPSSVAPEVGYNYGLTETPKIAATAGALRSTGNATDALFVNPANMATTRVYHLGAFASIWPQASRQTYGGAIVDSVVSSARVAGGFGGSFTRQDPDGVDRKIIDLRFALAYPFSDTFFVGAAGRYASVEQDGFPRGLGDVRPSVAAAGLEDDAIVKTFTFDAGMTLKPVDELSFSVVGYNLTDTGHGFLPLMLGGGAGVGMDIFSIEADLLGDFTTYDDASIRGMLGGQVLLGGHFPLRLGYRYDDGAADHTVTAGAGYLDDAYAVDLSLQRIVAGDSLTVVVLGFTYHLESTGLTGGGDGGF